MAASNVPEEIPLMRTLAGWCVRHRRIVVLLWLARPRRLHLHGGGGRHRLLEQLQLPPHAVVRRHQPAEVRRALPLGGHRSRWSSAPRATPSLTDPAVGQRINTMVDKINALPNVTAVHQPLRPVREPRQHDQHQRRPDRRLLPGPLRQAAEQHLEQPRPRTSSTRSPRRRATG